MRKSSDALQAAKGIEWTQEAERDEAVSRLMKTTLVRA